jgi:hypothetical protein
MYCPLCQAEYSAGLSECRACRVALVATREVAEASRAELWSGEDRDTLERLLAALDAAEIPSHSRESPDWGAQAGFRVVPERARLESVVWVLRGDAPRAEEILQGIEQAVRAEDPEVEEGGGK